MTRDELEKALIDRISNLMTPLHSILDESLGGALWFAASGIGTDYKSNARVCFIINTKYLLFL